MGRPAVSLAFGAAALAAMLGVLLATGPEQIVPRFAVIGALAIAAFATRALPETVTAFLCFLAFLALGAAPPGVIFSGFASGGIWLSIAGLIIGAAITGTGLGKQAATRIFARTGVSYARAVLLLALAGLGLGVLVPSTIPRVIILMPVAVSLASAMGYETGSRGQIGLAITAATSTLLPTFAILTANLPTIVHYGALETLYGIEPSYMRYLAAQLPVNIVRFALLLACLVPFARSGAQSAPPPADSPEPMTQAQRRLLGLLAVAIGFWATDALHGISPAWIALAAATVVLWPGAGLLAKDAMKTSVDMSPVFFLAAVFALSAVAQHIGLDRMVADALVPQLGLTPGADLHGLYAVSAFSSLISHLTTAPAAPIVLAPLAGPMAEAAGWPVLSMAMAQIAGISTPLLPYQAPPLILAMALAHIPARPLTLICLILALGTLLLGLPLTYLWWQLLGLI